MNNLDNKISKHGVSAHKLVQCTEICGSLVRSRQNVIWTRLVIINIKYGCVHMAELRSGFIARIPTAKTASKTIMCSVSRRCSLRLKTVPC